MVKLARHQCAAIDELVEWWEDLHDRGTGSQVARLVVPSGWGSTVVLDALAGLVEADESRLGAVLRLPGAEAPEGLAMQIAWLENLLDGAGMVPEVRRALGVDRAEGVAEVGLGTVGLLGLFTGLSGLVAGLPASLALNLIASARDRSSEGQLARVTRMAHALSSYSTGLPVAVLLDDAGLLEAALVERFVFTVLDRVNSNVLFVLTAPPDAPVLGLLAPRGRYSPRWERIGSVDVDPRMDEGARRRLVEMTAGLWPAAAIDRLAARARTFAELWAVWPFRRPKTWSSWRGMPSCASSTS